MYKIKVDYYYASEFSSEKTMKKKNFAPSIACKISICSLKYTLCELSLFELTTFFKKLFQKCSVFR